MLDCYDNIAIGLASTVLAVVLMFGLHSSAGYIALGAGAYFLIVGAAGFDAMMGGLRIVMHAQHNSTKRIEESALIAVLDERMAWSATHLAAKGIPLRIDDVLGALESRFKLDTGNMLFKDELMLALTKLSDSGRLHYRGALLWKQDFPYEAEAARCMYDKAMQEGNASLGASVSGLLANNNMVPYNRMTSKALCGAMRRKGALVAVPSAKAKRLLLDEAWRYDRQRALLGFGIASGAIEVVVCC